MTDQQLTECAAGAAGVSGEWIEHPTEGWGFFQLTGGGHWSPLADDGDALRLAVKLKIPLQFPDWHDVARTWGRRADTLAFDESALEHNGDLAAAVRRAIVRAAAALSEAGG